MGFQNSSWNISPWSLVILAASVSEISCKKQTTGGKNRNGMTAVGLVKKTTDEQTEQQQFHTDFSH